MRNSFSGRYRHFTGGEDMAPVLPQGDIADKTLGKNIIRYPFFIFRVALSGLFPFTSSFPCLPHGEAAIKPLTHDTKIQ